jgi:glucosyl-3-phosphoglycerate synthase
MCTEVGEALFHVVEDAGVSPAYDGLRDRYREVAEGLLRQYATDAAFNGFPFDRAGEREQVATYAEAIQHPTEDTRLPAWNETSLDPETVEAASAAGLDRATEL